MTNSTLPPPRSSGQDDARGRRGIPDGGWGVPPGGLSPAAPATVPGPPSAPAGTGWDALPPPPPAQHAADLGPRVRARAARSRPRQVPLFVVPLVGVAALLLGLGIGGVGGYLAGAASQVFGVTGQPTAIGPHADVGTGPVDAPLIEVGDFTVSRLDVYADFADDFFAEATITNTGGPWTGGQIEMIFRRAGEVLGSVGGDLPALDPGEAFHVELWGFDGYEPGIDEVEIRIG